jgi:hypothetical protein
VVKIRDGQVANRPIYAAIGVTLDGEKDILGLWAGTGGEGAKFWMSVLTDIKNRGVKDSFFLVCDGLKGFPEVVGNVWPLTTVQTLSVHNSDGGTVPPATCTVAGRTHADTHPSRTPCRPVPPRRRQTVNQPAGAATPRMVIAEIRFWRGTPTQPGEPQVVCPLGKATRYGSSRRCRTVGYFRRYRLGRIVPPALPY